jgi:hypothetical protein
MAPATQAPQAGFDATSLIGSTLDAMKNLSLPGLAQTVYESASSIPPEIWSAAVDEVGSSLDNAAASAQNAASNAIEQAKWNNAVNQVSSYAANLAQSAYSALQQASQGYQQIAANAQNIVSPQTQSVMAYWASQPAASAQTTSNPWSSLWSSGWAGNIAASGALGDDFANQMAQLNISGTEYEDMSPTEQQQYNQQAIQAINSLRTTAQQYQQYALPIAKNLLAAQQAASSLGGSGTLQGLGRLGAQSKYTWRQVKTIIGNFSNAVASYKAAMAKLAKTKAPAAKKTHVAQVHAVKRGKKLKGLEGFAVLAGV